MSFMYMCVDYVQNEFLAYTAVPRSKTQARNQPWSQVLGHIFMQCRLKLAGQVHWMEFNRLRKFLSNLAYHPKQRGRPHAHQSHHCLGNFYHFLLPNPLLRHCSARPSVAPAIQEGFFCNVASQLRRKLRPTNASAFSPPLSPLPSASSPPLNNPSNSTLCL
jgi:hypothetical protein